MKFSPDSTTRKRKAGPVRFVSAMVAKVSLAGLLVFHAVLLLHRIGDSSILDPAVLAKWAAALFLLVAVFAFQKVAPDRLRGGRPLIVFWLLVVLLHAGAPVAANDGELQVELASVVELALVIPAAVALFVFLTAVLRPAGLEVRETNQKFPPARYRPRSWHFVSPRSPPQG
ncbi:MAG: hypothetical protein ABI718_07790 [Acidobacteriota bacterium]